MNIIASAANGITIKPDDNNNTVAGSAPLIISNNIFASSGTFEQSNDADLYRIIIPAASRLMLTAKPWNVGTQNSGANVDIQTELYSGSMSFIKASNPLDSLQASIDTMLNAGTYYIRLKPVANAYASTYGMTGMYLINGTLIPTTILSLRKLDLSGKATGNTHSLHWLIDADEQITEASLEYSVDGSSFSSLSVTRDASGNFLYTPATTGTIFYRMKVGFNNGATHYSKIVSLNSTQENNAPKVVSNPVTNGILSVTAKEEYRLSITDASGRPVLFATLKPGINNIPVQQMQRGFYMVQFKSATNKLSTQKIIIQ